MQTRKLAIWHVQPVTVSVTAAVTVEGPVKGNLNWRKLEVSQQLWRARTVKTNLN